MKHFSVLAALCFSACAFLVHPVAIAQGASMEEIANWTPPLVQEIASHGWTLIGDSQQESAWFANVASSKNPNLRELALKVAYKGPSGHANKIDVIRGVFLCGSNGSPPDYLQEPLMFSADGNGIPMDDGGSLPPIAIVSGSILAVAVTKACKVEGVQLGLRAQNAKLPASGKCSHPSADYPIQAMRQGHQGVVYVTLTVGANDRPTDIHVQSSSGFSELDAAAVQAMANVVCNATPGTRMGAPVTFSMQGSM